MPCPYNAFCPATGGCSCGYRDACTPAPPPTPSPAPSGAMGLLVQLLSKLVAAPPTLNLPQAPPQDYLELYYSFASGDLTVSALVYPAGDPVTLTITTPDGLAARGYDAQGNIISTGQAATGVILAKASANRQWRFARNGQLPGIGNRGFILSLYNPRTNRTLTLSIPQPVTGGVQEAYRGIWSVSTGSNPTITPLATPTGLLATAVDYATIDLDWEGVDGAAGYEVSYGTTSSASDDTVFASASQVRIAGRSAQTAYYLKVRTLAVDPARNSPWSGSVAIVTPAQPSTVSLVLTAGTPTQTSVPLSWTGTEGAQSLSLQYSTDGQTWTTVAGVTPTATAYVITGLLAGTAYQFRLRILTPTPIRSTNIVPVTTVAAVGGSAPGQPTVLNASGVGQTQVNISWGTVSGATGYRLQQLPAGAGAAWVTLYEGPNLAYAHTGLAASTAYSYRLIAYNAFGASTPSATLSATTLAPATPDQWWSVGDIIAGQVPETAESLVLTSIARASTSITLSWTGLADAATLLLQRSTDGGTTWVNGPAVGASQGSPSYVTDSGLSPQTNYRYRLTATNSSNVARQSNVLLVATTATPVVATPTGFAVTAVGATATHLVWNRVSSASVYQVERSLDGQTGWTRRISLPQPTSGNLVLDETELSPAATYYYRVRAVDSAGVESGWATGSVALPAFQISITGGGSSQPIGAGQSITLTANHNAPPTYVVQFFERDINSGSEGLRNTGGSYTVTGFNGIDTKRYFAVLKAPGNGQPELARSAEATFTYSGSNQV